MQSSRHRLHDSDMSELTTFNRECGVDKSRDVVFVWMRQLSASEETKAANVHLRE